VIRANEQLVLHTEVFLSINAICLNNMAKRVNETDEVGEQVHQNKQTSRFVKQAVGVATAVSAEIAVMTVTGYYLGRFLDNKFAAAPWFTLLCVILGLAVGFVVVIKTLKRFL
jgi:F0F1-type ATP synthase assembly protein I